MNLGLNERDGAKGYLGFLMGKKDVGLIFENVGDIISDISMLWVFVWSLNFNLRVAQAILNLENFEEFGPSQNISAQFSSLDPFIFQFHSTSFMKTKFNFQTEYPYYSFRSTHHKIFSLDYFQTEFFLLTVEGQANFYPP